MKVTTASVRSRIYLFVLTNANKNLILLLDIIYNFLGDYTGFLQVLHEALIGAVTLHPASKRLQVNITVLGLSNPSAVKTYDFVVSVT